MARRFNLNPRVTETIPGIVRWVRDAATSINNFMREVNNNFPQKLHVDNDAVGNVGTGEDDLVTYSLPANTLSQDGNGVRVTAWGDIAGVSGTKVIKIYFGTQNIGQITIGGSDVHAWRATATVWLTATANQDYESSILESDSAVGFTNTQIANGSTTQDETAAITIKCTGEATNDDDIVQEGLLVEFLP